MLNDINVKNSWDSVRCKYQLKLITKTRKKNVAVNENYILGKMGLKFQNPSFNPMQNSILKLEKVDQEIRQIWYSTR